MEPKETFSERQIALAADNYDAQVQLFVHLRQLFEASNLTINDLAKQLDISVSEAQAWIDGEYDCTLSELRYLANALDAHVTYRTVATAAAWPTAHGAEWAHMDDAWLHESWAVATS